ncbi:hypothetical protein [Dactylosporangium matsuzakiense]|uniref:Uncharacterized protein n=1 Tax=Dactylosporangium matsuzakiense TaxID=53360 RepID=A0A9W6NN21_9ACTN|nr:hypothetical protein [Dactylosporangium matsuzakiense]GLL02846.1 hypothetical protein GCM10017581_045880 [Dactylosporangium matsuzakiense]
MLRVARFLYCAVAAFAEGFSDRGALTAGGTEELLGDLLGAGEDGVQGGAADQVGQTADQAGGTVVQMVGEVDEGFRPVVLQS